MFNGEPLVFSPFMIFVLGLSFIVISYFLGMLLHSSFMYEDKNNIKKNSKRAWTLCMTAGVGITFWMFFYGYYTNIYLPSNPG